MEHLRVVKQYPLDLFCEEKVTFQDVTASRIHTDTSLAFRLDVGEIDQAAANYLNNMLAPSSFEGLSSDQLKSENVFDLLDPLTSRFCTDNCMRNEWIQQAIHIAEENKKALQDRKDKEELKKKYDDFIKSLSTSN